MRIVTTTVDLTTLRDTSANAARVANAIALLDRIEARAVAPRTSLVVLPAGYLRARSGAPEEVAAEVAAPLVDAARARQLALVVGVDACTRGQADRLDADRLVADGKLPMWIVAWAPGARAPDVWRQRSTTSGNAGACDPARSRESRTLAVGERRVEVVTCGEAFNGELRRSIGERASELAAVVLPAHAARGSRFWQAQRWFATEPGLPALRAVHADRGATNAEGLRCRGAPAETALDVVGESPWIEPVEYRFRL